MIGWIRKSDEETYKKLMIDQCNGTYKIIEEVGDQVRVEFCSAAATAWMMAGYWFQMG